MTIFQIEPVAWPLCDILADIHNAAREEPPSRPRVSLYEIADEEAFNELLERIRDYSCDPSVVLKGANDLLWALDRYRNNRDFDARPPVDPIRKLRNARDQDLTKVLQSFLGNPDRARVLLGQLFCGAISVGVDLQMPRSQINDDGLWAVRLAARPECFRKALNHARAGSVKYDACNREANESQEKLSDFDLYRRLAETGRNPSRKRFHNLIRDARSAGCINLATLAAALRYTARRTVFKSFDLPGHWLKSIQEDPAKIGEVCKSAHAFLRRSRPGQGRVRDYDLERFCDAVADVYYDITGRRISYSKGTENSVRFKPGQVYGDGLEFMLSGLRMIDAYATVSQAQKHIDRIRSSYKQLIKEPRGQES